MATGLALFGAGQLRTTMFIGVGLIEAVPIIAVVISFMLLNK